MPENIKTQYMEKMFPYEFFNELSQKMTEYVITNPLFLLGDRVRGSEQQRKQYYHQNRKPETINALNKNNILEVEPFGEVLILDVCCRAEDANAFLNNPEKRSLIPLTSLIVQYYDSSDQPVFSKDVDETTIASIPEILWDDPRLMIAMMSMGQGSDQETQIGIVKIPESIEATIFESADDTDETGIDPEQ